MCQCQKTVTWLKTTVWSFSQQTAYNTFDRSGLCWQSAADSGLTKTTQPRSVQWRTPTPEMSAMYAYIIDWPICSPGKPASPSLAYFPSFCFHHSTSGIGASVWLVTQLCIPAAFLIAAHLAYIQSVLLHSGSYFHVCWIGLLTGMNKYGMHSADCKLNFDFWERLPRLPTGSRKPPPLTDFQNPSTGTTPLPNTIIHIYVGLSTSLTTVSWTMQTL